MTAISSPREILYTNSKKVSCNGTKDVGAKDNNNSESGHPLVYLDMGKNNFVVCPYCSKYFTLQKSSSVLSKKSKK